MSKDVTKESEKQFEEFIDAHEEEIDVLQDYATKNDIIMIGFIGTYYSKRFNPVTSQSASFNIRDEFGIERILTEIENKIPNSNKKKMFLLVNSMGGSLSSAFKISRIIREKFDDITVFVPHYALSGGTMLSLVGDRIRMGMMSQLSPLDVQLQYDGQQVSVNSLFSAQNTLNEIFSTNKPEELPFPYRHLAESLDPVILEEWTGHKIEGQLYTKEILEKSKYEDPEELSTILTTRFHTHGFVIQYNLAKTLGLKVEKHDVDIDSWNLMRHWLSKYINTATDRHYIRYVIPKDSSDKNLKK